MCKCGSGKEHVIINTNICVIPYIEKNACLKMCTCGSGNGHVIIDTTIGFINS